MINKRILQKAIEKAVKNSSLDSDLIDILHILNKTESTLDDFSVYEIIFSHEFAKAFWGEEKQCPHCGGIKLIEINYGYISKMCETCHLKEEFFIDGWKGHLQQIVLEKEPLKYLEKFL